MNCGEPDEANRKPANSGSSSHSMYQNCSAVSLHDFKARLKEVYRVNVRKTIIRTETILGSGNSSAVIG